jgi:hypothetical protein
MQGHHGAAPEGCVQREPLARRPPKADRCRKEKRRQDRPAGELTALLSSARPLTTTSPCDRKRSGDAASPGRICRETACWKSRTAPRRRPSLRTETADSSWCAMRCAAPTSSGAGSCCGREASGRSARPERSRERPAATAAQPVDEGPSRRLGVALTSLGNSSAPTRPARL